MAFLKWNLYLSTIVKPTRRVDRCSSFGFRKGPHLRIRLLINFFKERFYHNDMVETMRGMLVRRPTGTADGRGLDKPAS